MLTQEQKVEIFLAVVIICGPPPPKPGDQGYPWRYGDITKNTSREHYAAYQKRCIWCDDVVEICVDRYGIRFPQISIFIIDMDRWWDKEKLNNRCKQGSN